jgi:hypothetical protein
VYDAEGGVGGRADAERVQHGGVAMAWGYTGRFNTTLQNTESIPIVEVFKPRIVLPSHHEDETGIGAHYDMPIYPLGIAVRDKFPDAQTIDPLYLSALCFDTHSKEFFVGR